MRWRELSLILGVGVLCISCGGKTQGQRLTELEKGVAATQHALGGVERRVGALENRTDTLAADVRVQSERTYEVRSKAGKKTGMVAYPMQVLPTPPQMATPAPDLIPAPQPKATVPLPLRPTADVPMPPAMTTPGMTTSAMTTSGGPVASDAPAPASTAPTPPAVSAAPVASPPVTSRAVQVPAPRKTTALPRPVAANTAAASATPTRGNASPALSLPPTQAPVIASQHSTPVAPLQISPGVTRAPAPSPRPASSTGNSLSLPPENGASGMAAPQAQEERAPAKLPAAAKGEDAAYKAALQLVTAGKGAEGRAKFTEFLNAYPRGRYAANAYYWMGESYYAERNYPEALMQFKQATSQFPRHHKSADALLKAGMTYQRMGDKENAALQFKALLADFPNSDAARLARGKGWGR